MSKAIVKVMVDPGLISYNTETARIFMLQMIEKIGFTCSQDLV